MENNQFYNDIVNEFTEAVKASATIHYENNDPIPYLEIENYEYGEITGELDPIAINGFMEQEAGHFENSLELLDYEKESLDLNDEIESEDNTNSGMLNIFASTIFSSVKNTKATSYNQSQVQKSGLAIADIVASIGKLVNISAIRQNIVSLNQSNPSATYRIDNSGTLTVDSVFTEAVHQFQIANYLNPADHDGMIGQSTIETLGFFNHGLKPKLNSSGFYGQVQLNKSYIKPQVPLLTNNEFTSANWYQYIMKPSWLGVKITDGIHLLLLRKLREAETWLLSQPQYKGMTPASLGKALGFNADTRFSGARLSAAKQAMHGYGLAVDINVSGNPWIGAGWVQYDKVLLLERTRMLTALKKASGNQHLPGNNVFEYLHSIAQTSGNDTAAAFTTLKQRNDEFIDYLKNNASELNYWKSSQSFAKRNPLNGFLNLHADLVYALRQVAGLAWGAIDFGPRQCGDIMHFDTRTMGIGKFLCEERGGFVPKSGHPAINKETISYEANREQLNDNEFIYETEHCGAEEEERLNDLDTAMINQQYDYDENEMDSDENMDEEYKTNEILTYSPFNEENPETGSETLNKHTAEVIEQEAAKVQTPSKPCEGLYCWAKTVLNNQFGINLPINNVSDVATKNAIGDFQLKNNLTQTKRIDPATERALLECDAIQKHKGTAGESAAAGIISSAKSKIEDWTKQAVVNKTEITNSYRDPRKLWAFVLHHMAFKRKGRKTGKFSDPDSYLSTGAHFCIMLDGRVIQLHQVSRMIWHAQCTSPRSVSVEFEGNFPNIKGRWWIDKKSSVQNKDVPTQAQYDSGKFLAGYLKVILGTTHILAHRQSADSRENDPGPDIWYNVGQWAIDNLSMTDGGPTFKCGTGNPILPEWRTWGDKTATLIHKEYEEMNDEADRENTDPEPENFEPMQGGYETGNGDYEVENLYNDESGIDNDFENENENENSVEEQQNLVMDPPDMFSEDNLSPAQPVILALGESNIPFSNETVTFYKMYDTVNEKFIGESYDEQGNKVTLFDLRSKENEITENVNNKIHPTLQTHMSKVADTAPVDIAVWLNIEVNEPLKTNFRPEELSTMPNQIADYRKKLAVTIGDTVRKVTIERSNIQVQRVSELLPLFFAKASKRAIDLIKNDPLVLGIFYNDRTYYESLNTSLSKSGAAEAQTAGMTNLGKDIKVAVWENAPDVLTNLTIEGYYDSTTPNVSDHSRLVSAIIKNKEPGKSKGYAPNCKLYSANLSGSDVFAPLEWAVKQGCSIINRSFHQDTDQVNSGMQLSDYITDALALSYPYPLIVQASGNTGQPDDTALGITPPGNEYVNHKGYNSIAVGSHDEQSERKISSFSTFRNPSSPHNDRELPEICALGENISAVGLVDWGGTSFASPAVAGSAALLQSISPVIKVYPEATRALLLAGSKRNVDGGLWYEDLKRTPKVDQKDGTGALNIYESIAIAKKPYQPKKVALDKGWDCGRFDASGFGPDKISLREWKITVPQNRKHVKIALTWNSNANYQEVWVFKFLKDTTLDMDLDIVVYDEKNKFIATSSSYDNSFEIADYIAKGGQTLTVKVRDIR